MNNKERLPKRVFYEEIIAIIQSDFSDEEIVEKLSDYHENDIAQALSGLNKEERLKLYDVRDRVDLQYSFLYR